MDGGAPSEGERAPTRGAESRERLVDAAVELVADHYRSGTELRDVFAYLTPGAVATRAGLSRALLYHHWGESEQDGPSAFERFLGEVAERLVAASVPADEVSALAEQLPANVTDVITTLSAYEMSRSDGWATEEWRAAMSMSLQGVGPTAPLEDLIARLAEFYRRLSARLGLEPVPPLTHEDIALSIMAVIDGFSLHLGVVPERIMAPVDWQPAEPSAGGAPEWTLVAIAVESVVRNMMRPVTEQ